MGYLLYTANGHMSVSISSPNRLRFAANDIGSGTVEERAEAARTYIAYAGPYEVRGNQVVHHVEVSFFPNMVGSNQERFVTLASDRLILSTPPIVFQGQEQVGHLVWERAGSRSGGAGGAG